VAQSVIGFILLGSKHGGGYGNDDGNADGDEQKKPEDN
jgi:hypothetical protein